MLRTLTPALGLLLMQLHAAPVQAAAAAPEPYSPTAERTMDQNSKVILPAPPPEPSPPPAPPLRHFTLHGR
jgi:hypothetical protein